MNKRYSLLFLIVLLIPEYSLYAQEKLIALKKFKSVDIGNPAITGSSQIRDNKLIIMAGGAD